MRTRQRRQFGFRGLLIPLASLATVAYFAHHATVGDFGLESYDRLKTRESALNADLAALVAERRALEARVALLRPENLDVDLVDERARLLLGYVKADEIVVALPKR